MMKNKFLGFGVVLCLVLAFGAIALAVGQAPAQLQKQPNPAPIPAADLQIKWIAASPCGCEAEAAAVDAIILTGPVTVRVHNAGPRAADAEVNIAAMLHRFGSVVPQFPQKIHLEKNQSAHLVFFPNRSAQIPLLICRSKGIKAEIKRTSGGIDPNLSNNTLTIKGCQPIVE
jgi:hypothetical protein